jgi:hypothetical protein
VFDVLPAGLQYLYATVSVGSYDETTGIWTVGNLPNGESRTMSIKAKVDVTFANEAVIDLGIANEYNLFVFEDLIQPSSDTEGKVAVGRSADLANYSVGYEYPIQMAQRTFLSSVEISLSAAELFTQVTLFMEFQQISRLTLLLSIMVHSFRILTELILTPPGNISLLSQLSLVSTPPMARLL